MNTLKLRKTLRGVGVILLCSLFLQGCVVGSVVGGAVGVAVEVV